MPQHFIRMRGDLETKADGKTGACPKGRFSARCCASPFIAL